MKRVETQLRFLRRKLYRKTLDKRIYGTKNVTEQRERSFGILRKPALFGGRSDSLKQRILPRCNSPKACMPPGKRGRR
jgi:hypothetical protein